MRIIFMGNGPFAVPALETIAGNFEVPLVVARPDKPQGKRREILPGPIHQTAKKLNLPIELPESVNTPEYVERLAREKADLLVVADFGQILSPECLSTTKFGGINIHASLLPKYRGAAPIVWAIYDGEPQTGVTIIQMTPKLDAGGILLQESVPIWEDETAGELESRLSQLGATLALKAAQLLESGQVAPKLQSDQLATKAPRVKKEDGKIDWTRSAEQVHNQVRAMQPWPIAFTHWVRSDDTELRLQILKTRPSAESQSGSQPGQVVGTEQDAMLVQTGNGILKVLRVKPAGKGEMPAVEFLRGQPADAPRQLR